MFRFKQRGGLYCLNLNRRVVALYKLEQKCPLRAPDAALMPASIPKKPMSRQRKLQNDTEFRVLRMLESNPDMTQRDLAKNADISIGALNYCMKALIFKGWVKMQNFSDSKNKFGYIYVLTPLGIRSRAQLAQAFLKRKLAEYEALQQEIEQLKSDPELKLFSEPLTELSDPSKERGAS